MEVTQQKLTFGYNAALPANVTVAWGARAILEKDGFLDYVWDRKSTFGSKDDIKDLCKHLDDSQALVIVRQRVKELVKKGELNRNEDKDFVLYDDGDVIVRGNPAASDGYLKLCAYWKKEERRPT